MKSLKVTGVLYFWIVKYGKLQRTFDFGFWIFIKMTFTFLSSFRSHYDKNLCIFNKIDKKNIFNYSDYDSFDSVMKKKKYGSVKKERKKLQNI